MRTISLASLLWIAAVSSGAQAQAPIDEARGAALMESGKAFAARHEDTQALEAFRAAANIYSPAAPERADSETTPFETRFAEALAWTTGIQARMKADNLLAPPGGISDMIQLPGAPPLCRMKLTARSLTYPNPETFKGRVGAVVIKLEIDSAGKVVDKKALASLPTAAFGAAAARATWTATKDETASAPNCRMETKSYLLPIGLQFDPENPNAAATGSSIRGAARSSNTVVIPPTRDPP